MISKHYPKMVYRGGRHSGDEANQRIVHNADDLEQAREAGFSEYDPLAASARKDPSVAERAEREAEDRRQREEDQKELAALRAEKAERDRVAANVTKPDGQGNSRPGVTGLEPGSGATDAANPGDVKDSKPSPNSDEAKKDAAAGGDEKPKAEAVSHKPKAKG